MSDLDLGVMCPHLSDAINKLPTESLAGFEVPELEKVAKALGLWDKFKELFAFIEDWPAEEKAAVVACVLAVKAPGNKGPKHVAIEKCAHREQYTVLIEHDPGQGSRILLSGPKV